MGSERQGTFDELLDDWLVDPEPNLEKMVCGLLMSMDVLTPTGMQWKGSICAVDRRRLLAIHRAYQHRVGEPIADYTEYLRRPSGGGGE